MEDAAETVVPLRPGFDIQFRGFDRNQVSEHIEALEDQLKLVTIDRNEAVQLNSDLRSLYDSTRQDLNDAHQRLERIESSDTGLPAASQRVQNMLANAEEEVQTLREQAQHQAENIRGAAETEARQLIDDAESTAGELHTECTRLLAELESRRDQLGREYSKQVSDLREREHRLRQSIRDAYKTTMESAQQEADTMLANTQEQCGRINAKTERRRLEVQQETDRKQAELERLRSNVLSALDTAAGTVDESVTVLRAQAPSSEVETDITDSGIELGQELEADRETSIAPDLARNTDTGTSPDDGPGLRLPEQRDDVRTYTIPLNNGSPNTNGHGTASGVTTPTNASDTAERN